MSAQRESPPRRPPPPPPDLADDEVDLGRYWASVAARWWLPLLGLVLGAIVGYLVAVGGGSTYQGQAVVSLGTPLAVGGGILPSVQTISDQYVNPKIATLNAQVKADEAELASLDKRLTQEQALLGSLSGAEKLAAIGIIGIAEQRRSVVTQDLLSTRPLLQQAKSVERGRVLTRAVGTKTTARSKRNSAVVGAFLGLLLGIAAALLWEPLAGRFARRPAL